MNKYQRVVVIVAAVNIVLMLMFPPFLDTPIRRGMLPSFEGFYPLLSAYGRRIHSELLTLEVMFVVINGLIAWLVLDRNPPAGESPEFRYTRALGLFAAANIALIVLFPPFESYSALSKLQAPAFDGFYFVAGDKRNRHFFIPLLHLEVTLVIIDALVVWLLFNTVRRADLAAKDKILELAAALPAAEREKVSVALGAATGAEEPDGAPQLGAGPDRRRRQDPRYKGPERRKGGDRRQKPRVAIP